MFEHILSKLGLSPSEIDVYEALLEAGQAAVPTLMGPTGLSRTNLYNVLEGLKAKGLVLEVIDEKKKAYQPTSPEALRRLIDAKQQAVNMLTKEANDLIPTLVSAYRASTGKAVVRYFSGIDAVEEALQDTLNQTGEILTFADDRVGTTTQSDRNARYVRKRKARGIPKKLILANATPETRASHPADALTDIRYTTGSTMPFLTAIEIYQNKVSFLSVGDDPKGIVIEDDSIANGMRVLFYSLWNQLGG